MGRQPQRVSRMMSRNGRIQASIMETPVSISTSISTMATEAAPNGTTQKPIPKTRNAILTYSAAYARRGGCGPPDSPTLR